MIKFGTFGSATVRWDMMSAMMANRVAMCWMSKARKRSAEVMPEPGFAELVERLHNNEREAVDLLITRYGQALRRAIERALFDRRVASAPGNPTESDASDIYQTVLLLFLARLERSRFGDSSSGALKFDTPGHLVAYLILLR
jgi:hypothetical protein